ncbi:popeye domain-containing protein 3-like [Styela clava]|uniref:popeye domain-containing protein 3-like n=1 Tax=Styela clava TaxID=7725 RepID=UPI00193AC0AA|nr:popeye domain-containing protein 3-like [Styela clava]
MAATGVEVAPRGDTPGSIFPDITTIGYSEIVTTTEVGNFSSYGPRGDTWEECIYWFKTMPGSFFQLGNLFLLMMFMAGGTSVTCAVFTHFLGILSFTSFILWAYIDACSLDIMCWSGVIILVNLIQLIITCRRSRRIQNIMGKDGMGHLHSIRFSPFGVPPRLFVELVTCKGCEITHMEAGQNYATENKTPIDKISLLLNGRMKVLCNGKFLHYITQDTFIDSPEWTVAEPDSTRSFKVTITSDAACTYISWKRKGLIALLSKHKSLKKIMYAMIAKDVTAKFYDLNDRCITERGFRYDIRLPCVMSLPEDVEKRNKAFVASHSAPGTPGLDSEDHQSTTQQAA